MANEIYAYAKQLMLSGSLSWTGDTIKAVLVNAANYTVNTTTHQFLSTIAATARVAASGAFSSLTATNGVADAADVTFSTVSGDTVNAIVVYKDSGVEASSPLIAYIDTGTGLPITPGGANIVITWDNGANKIFAI